MCQPCSKMWPSAREATSSGGNEIFQWRKYSRKCSSIAPVPTLSFCIAPLVASLPQDYRWGVLVGRDADCARIDQLLGGARGGRTGALAIRGEAGIGKSALLE